MNITVTVDEVTLDTVVHSYDGDVTTVGDGVVHAITERLTRDRDIYPTLRTRVEQVRDEEIRKSVAPLVIEALTAPVRQTNSFGEPIGPETTLSSLIMAEAKKLLTHKSDNYGNRNETILQKLVADEVRAAFKTLITDEIKAARAEVASQIGSLVADAVAAGMRK